MDHGAKGSLQHSEQHPRAEPTQNAGSPASHLPASARRGAVGHASGGGAGTLVPAAGMGVKLKLVANLPTTLPKHPTMNPQPVAAPADAVADRPEKVGPCLC